MFRPDTWDRDIWLSVTAGNEYGLAARFGPGDVVLDIGAHIGAFSYLALDHGAGRVVSVEPDPENAYYLRHNVHMACGATDRCVIVTAAAGEADGTAEFTAHPVNTGGGAVGAGEGRRFPVAVVAFDRLVDFAAGESGTIRLLKLDCEGSEWPVLHTSRRLHRVRAIVGEYHVPESGRGSGGAEELDGLLRGAGFEVLTRPTAGRMGLFTAWRAGSAV